MTLYRRVLSWAVRIGVSAGLFVWLLTRMDISGILSAMRGLPVYIPIIGFFMYLAAQVLSSFRWRVLGRGVRLNGSPVAFMLTYFVGSYFNLFLPTSMGGDVIRIALVSGPGGKSLPAAYSVLADRLFGLLAMVILGGLAVTVGDVRLPLHVAAILALIGAGGIGLLVGLPSLARIVRRFRPKLFKYVGALMHFRQNRSIFIISLVLSFVIQGIGICMVILLGRGLGIQLPSLFFIAVVPLVTILTTLPISISGIGVREGAFVYFLGLRGVPAEQALTLGVLQFVVMVAASLLGGLIYGLGLHRRSLVCFEGNSEWTPEEK